MFDHLRADIGRYGPQGPFGTLRLLMGNQGVWASCCYRVGRHLNDHRLPPVLRQFVMAFYHVWWKLVQITTGIWISPDCRVDAPGGALFEIHSSSSSSPYVVAVMRPRLFVILSKASCSPMSQATAFWI